MEGHGATFDLRAAPNKHKEEQCIFLLMQNVAIQNEVEKAPFFRPLKGEGQEGRVKSLLLLLPSPLTQTDARNTLLPVYRGCPHPRIRALGLGHLCLA